MGSVGLLYVGAVLFVNGCSLLGWVKGKDHAPMDLFVGILQVITPLYLIFTSGGDAAVILGASGLFLFGFTYLYVCMTQFFNLNGTGLGWFCGFVVLAAIVYAFFNIRDGGAAGWIWGVEWISWAWLWLLFWLILSMGRTSLTRFTGAVCLVQGLVTGLIPALILLGQPSWFGWGLCYFIAGVGIIDAIVFYALVKTPSASAAATSEAEAAA